MKKWQKGLMFLGRIFISLLFILSALNKIIQWQETENSFTNLLLDWQNYVSFSPALQSFFTSLLEWVPAFLITLLSLELLGGLLIFFGIKVKFGALLLIIFLIPSTFLFHHFWFISGEKREIELLLFLENFAILGGLLYVAVFGSRGKEKQKEHLPASFHNSPMQGKPGGGQMPHFSNSDLPKVKSIIK